MQRFSIRSVLIFVICLLVATLLIGLGVGSVIKFKQRDISSKSVNELVYLSWQSEAFL
jgi:hypothetical protein